MRKDYLNKKFLSITAASLLLASLIIINLPSSWAEPPLVINEKSFNCLHDMQAVRGFFVSNLSGHLDETLTVANSTSGGEYPPGSVIQLIPNEAMVKREKGFNPITKDWEFFELDVSSSGTVIRKRGFQEVKNRFDGNCFACHVKAKPEFDLICEQGHGCDALPISRQVIEALQNTDPRCSSNSSTFLQKITAWLVKLFTSL
ncbi:MAG TPA: hypothetical protein VFV48_09770 [Pseudomonadales bacterium]|nr:hypothetical protein [Pseudomonadales bacterium]